jgi:1,2-diacylglycerol 3-beta-galactosyltransferase
MESSDKKKILILTADAGFGHRSAATAVSDALKQTYGNQLHIDIVNPLDNKKAPFFLRESQSDYDKIIRSIPELYKVGYEASDSTFSATVFERALTVLLYDVMFEIIQEYQPDVILTTYPLYQAPFTAVRLIHRINIPMYTVITDLVTVHHIWFDRHIDGLFVPTEEVKQLAIDSKIPEDRIEITGIPVSPAYKQISKDKKTLRNELGWDPDLTTILAVGSRRVEQLEATMNVINHFGEKLQLIGVAGKDSILYQQLMEIDWHIPTHIYEFVSDMPHFMMASDCIITKAGGLIVTESLAAGLPIMLIDIIPGQETGNAEYVVNHGAGQITLEPTEVLETLYHWLSNNRKILVEKSQNAKCIGKPDSAIHIAKVLYSASQNKYERNTVLLPELRQNLVELLNRYKIKIPEDRFFTKRS